MALHFTLVGADELSIHFDIDGIGELLKGLEGAISAAKENKRSGAPDGTTIAVAAGSPGALRKVTLTLLEPPRSVTH
jgi:hypothetical protein